MNDDLQFQMDEMARWCYRHKTTFSKRISVPDFNIKWGLRSGYTVTIRIKARSFFYRRVEILRTHKTSAIEALHMARIAAEEKIYGRPTRESND